MRQWSVIPIAALLAVLLAAPSEGKAQFLLGAQGSFSPGPVEDVRAGGVGIRAAFPVGPARWGLELSGSVDFFFPDCAPDDCTYLGLNANAAYRHVRPGRGMIPYVGTGVHYRHFERELVGGEEVLRRGEGVNALAGTEFFPGRNARPFVEIRYEWMVDLRSQFVVTGGILF